MKRWLPRDWVVFILAIGVVTAINFITVAVLIDAIVSEGPGLSDNATQILSAAFTGTFGLLGGYIGYKAGQASREPVTPPDDTGT